MELEWFWLCSVQGIYRKDMELLLRYFKSPAEVRKASEKELRSLTFLNERLRKRLVNHRFSFEAEKEYHKCQDRGIDFISCGHSAYPRRLLQITDYPYGLFVKGRLPDREERCMAVIGARVCSSYGKNMARELAGLLAENGISVVSGLAYGIDGAAQDACLQAGGRSYGVLGCGADICYPREHLGLYCRMQMQGGVISEYPPGTRALPFHFPLRNRIISGLSETVVVVEAKNKSGSLITADLALEQGRDVYAFPGRLGDALSEGCNRLISQGAGVITGLEDFLKENGVVLKIMKKKKNYNIGLETAENLVYSCVDSQTRSLQSISDEIKMPVNQVMRALCSLQLKGLVEETAKNHYAKKR